MARILLVVRPDSGGAYRHVAQLSAALAARGHTVAVCGPLAHRAGELPVEVIDLPIERQLAPRRNLLALGGYLRALRRFAPDLVHAHGSQGSVIARLGRIAAPSVPLVYTPHLFPFDNYPLSGAQRRAYELVERVLGRAATRVVCVCERERQLAERVGASKRARVVYNGVDAVETSRRHPRLDQADTRGPLVCAVAELRESKGVISLVEAFPLILAEHPEAKLAIAGDGAERDAIVKRVEELRIGLQVILLGATDGPDEVLAAADVFVNPAYAEAMPYTILEAMSARVPVVATDVGGTAEALSNGVSGLLVSPGDPAALARSVNALLADPERARRMADEAHKGYMRRFTLERMTAGVLAVYAELGIDGARA